MQKLLSVGPLILAAGVAYGDDLGPNQGLSGDWGGLRTQLLQEGIDFQLGYTTEIAYNTQGGDRNLLSNADQVTLGSTLDLDRLFGWANSTVQVTATYRSGGNLSSDAGLNTLQQVQEIYGRGQTWRWTQFWYDKRLLGDAVDIKFGRLGIGEDFFSFACTFENLSFCGSIPGNIVSDWYNFPVSQWGTRLKWNIHRDWYAQIGIYQVNPNYLTRDEAFRLNNPPGTIGAFIPVETGWSPKLGPQELPGSYRIGAWYDTSNQPDVFTAANHLPLEEAPGVAPLMRRGERGVYGMFSQQILGSSQKKPGNVTIFLNLVQADKHTAIIDQALSIGCLIQGPLSARPQDDVGIAVGRTHVNSRVASGEALENGLTGAALPTQGSEYPMELYYTVNATPWLALRPNIQYIANPGGISQNRDVVVLGLKASVKF